MISFHINSESSRSRIVKRCKKKWAIRAYFNTNRSFRRCQRNVLRYPDLALCRSWYKIPNIEDIIFSEEYLAEVDKRTFILECSEVSKETSLEIEKQTKGQHLNSNWHIGRQLVNLDWF
jgi:hypothetical protein